jgi:uncharacterized membrane protein
MSQVQSNAAVRVPRPRLDAVDWLRGFVMVVMALDHVRDFFGDVSFDAIDPHQTTVRHFFTRWITHFCAPTFIFLTGVGIYLTKTRGRTKPELSWFLLTRGAWLLLLEMTYIRFFWSQFDLSYENTSLGVFWSISWSMLLMSLIVFLPDWLITTLGVAMILGHNSLDGLGAERLGAWGGFWTLIHDHGINDGIVQIGWAKFATAYKIVPWLGVMMGGYGFGRVLLWDREPRNRFIVGLGTCMIAAFIVLRGINVYGDRTPRFNQPDSQALADLEKARTEAKVKPTINPRLPPTTFAVLSFLNCEKYPPSLDYLLMTLGPALLLLVAADRPLGPLGRAVVTFGRVPLFYYLLHIALIVPTAVVIYRIGFALGVFGDITVVQAGGLIPLWGVYIVWLALLVILYFPCRWYAGVKARSRNPLFSYL